MGNLSHSDSIFVARPADALYEMILDITRMGEWSPVCKACWWDPGDGPRVDAWFTGRNETDDRTWETHCKVIAAHPGREFAFAVGGSWTRWGYTFSPESGGTTVTESWELLPDGVAFFEERFSTDAEAQIASRARDAEKGIPETLAAFKRVAESTLSL
jgi:hypothetical protein